jgi:streptomycin 6-kinase
MGLPEEIRVNVLRFFGDDGQAWIDALPAIVATLADRWGLTLGRSYSGGSHALVLAATCSDGTEAILKVPARNDENRAEAAALRCYEGDGAALLYDSDPATGGLLLELLESGTPLRDHPDREEAVDVACALLRRLRRPVPAGHPFPLVRDLLRLWAGDQRAVEARYPEALGWSDRDEFSSTVRALGVPDGAEVLVNRDANMGNVLAAQREPWLLIDPKPLVGEPAFDGGWLLVDTLRPAPSRAVARRLAAHIGDGLGVPPDRVRAWAFVRAAQAAHWELSSGGDPSALRAIAAALSVRSWVAADPAPGNRRAYRPPGRARLCVAATPVGLAETKKVQSST